MKRIREPNNPLSDAFKKSSGRLTGHELSLIFGTVGQNILAIRPPISSRNFADADYTEPVADRNRLRSLSIRWHGSPDIGATAVSIFSLDEIIHPIHQIRFSPFQRSAPAERSATFLIASPDTPGELKPIDELQVIEIEKHGLFINPYIRAVQLALAGIQPGR